jgi:osmotically-inducible protein OsmY
MASINPLVERTLGIFRQAGRRAGRLGRRATSAASGKVEAVRHGTSAPKSGMDDVTLARKVETELFRDADAPKGQVDISAVDGVVELRGQVKRPEDMKELEAKARSIPEVRDVRNLLHLPKTPSPTRTDSPPSHQKRGETQRAGPPSD